MKTKFFATLKTKEWLVLVLFVALGVVLQVRRASFGPRINWVDDLYWTTRLDRVLGGQVPYRDFQEQYGPLQLYFFAPWYNLLGHDLFAARVVVGIFFTTMAVLVIFFALKSFELRGWRFLGSFLLLALAFESWFILAQGRGWWGIGVLLAVEWATKLKRSMAVFLCGVFTIIVGFFSVEQGIFSLMAVLAGMGMTSTARCKKVLGSYLLGVLAGLATAIVLMVQAGMLSPYIKISFLETARLQNAAYGLAFPEFNFYDLWSLVWYLPFVLIILEAIYWGKKRTRLLIVPMLLVFGLLSLKVYLGRTDVGHLAVDCLAIWLLGILTWFDFVEKRRKLVTVLFFAFLVASSGLLMDHFNGFWKGTLKSIIFLPQEKGGLTYFKEGRIWIGLSEAKEIREVLDFVEKNIPVREEIYPYPVASGLSSFMGRTVPNYYEQATFAPTTEDQKKIIFEVERRKIPWVIYSRRDYVIPLARMSEVYIWETFQPVIGFGDFLVMKRVKDWTFDDLNDFFDGGTVVYGMPTAGGIEFSVNDKSTEKYSTLVIKYRLGFWPGLASFSKTALTVSWREDGEQGERVYMSPFLYPGGWRETWLELPRPIKPESMRLTLSWPGGFNPRATSVEWGEIKLR